jgi:hypothetical protein
MKTKPLTFLLALTFLFLFSSVSYSTTFKCEFIQEKFTGGKTNEVNCTGDPELLYPGMNANDRKNHCLNTEVVNPRNFEDYVDFEVDLDKKTISWISQHGGPRSELNIIRESRDILSAFKVPEFPGGAISYLITFRKDYWNSKRKQFGSLYIPESGKSIVVHYKTTHLPKIESEPSSARMRFGICNKTKR